MKKLPLLPHRYRQMGLILFVPALALGIAYLFFDYTIPFLEVNLHPKETIQISTNFTDELAAISLIASFIMIAFSREKIEDEAIQYFRLEALQWAVWVNYAVLILCIMLCYGGLFFTVMTFNLFTVLIIFIIRFRFVLYKYNKASV